MSDRDDLAATLRPLTSSTYATAKAVDALWSAGWRKKPSREELIALFVGDQAFHYLAPRIADAVLALLDGPTND